MALSRRRLNQANLEKDQLRVRSKTLAKYGLLESDYQMLLRAQEGLCAICNERGATCLDHNHATGEFRALLCNNCNTSLGFIKENPYSILNMLNYIYKHNYKKPINIIEMFYFKGDNK